MPPILYLIDGHALAYRTYFALSVNGGDRFATRSGEPTAGIYGFASVLLRLLEQEKPEYLAVAFDTGKTFRDDLYPAYKATRAKMPEDLRPQIERIRQMIDAFHFPRLEMEGFEADDVLGSIAKQAVVQGLGVKIITGDRDLLQLVNERIIVNLAGSKLSDAKDFTPADVLSYLGVTPDQVVDYKALVGDASDNIPGVKGIGEKTAVSLLQTYPTLEDIYAHLDEIPTRVRTKLEDGRQSALLSQKLATIRTDVHLILHLEEAKTDHINYPAVEEFFRAMDFRTLTTRLLNMRGGQTEQAGAVSPGQQLGLFGETKVERVGLVPGYHPEFVVVNTSRLLQEMGDALNAAELIAVDTETTSTDPMRAALVGISLAVKPGVGYYIPVGHHSQDPQLPLEQVQATLRPILADASKKIIGHHLKYDLIVLLRHGFPLGNLYFDSMIAEFLIDPSTRRLGLKDMADAYLDVQMTHIEEMIGTGKNQITMADVPIERAAPYAAADAEVTLRLEPLLSKKLQERNGEKLLREIELPLVAVLAEMEQNGIALDVSFFGKMSGELRERMGEIEHAIFQQVGYTFNINSTQQLSKVLFDTLHLQPPDRKRKTASGHFSTSADVLDELTGQHPVVDLVLEYRELAKLKSTYVEALPLEINPQTGRVHTSFSQTASVTGRLASSEPNLQNIPTRTDLGRRVRQGFIADAGNLLLSVDYSQIELRIVAHMSGDAAMLEAFREGQDIHSTTAAAIYNVPLADVSKDMRRHAKAINFGLIYGMSSFGLSRSTDLTLAESENFVKAYFERFPGVKSYLDGIRKLAAEQGYVETLLGRRRYFPNLRSQANVAMRNREEREAINSPIQGTAADIMKLAMIEVLPALREAGLRARVLLQVHDELVLECPQIELKAAADLVQRVMSAAYPLSIPLETDARWGKNWGQMQSISQFMG